MFLRFGNFCGKNSLCSFLLYEITGAQNIISYLFL